MSRQAAGSDTGAGDLLCLTGMIVVTVHAGAAGGDDATMHCYDCGYTANGYVGDYGDTVCTSGKETREHAKLVPCTPSSPYHEKAYCRTLIYRHGDEDSVYRDCYKCKLYGDDNVEDCFDRGAACIPSVLNGNRGFRCLCNTTRCNDQDFGADYQEHLGGGGGGDVAAAVGGWRKFAVVVAAAAAFVAA